MLNTSAISWQQLATGDSDRWFCNIVWGGNRLAVEKFTTPGLGGYLFSVPCANHAVGGDIYHITVCNHGVFSKFLLADVAGHGDAAAAISSRLQQPLLRLMSEVDNSALLEELNDIICIEEASGSFATAAMATYNHWDNSWTYAYAGHPYALIRRNDRWQVLPECHSAPPVGVLVDSRYYQNEIRLTGSDWLFMFSDGVYEIRQTGSERLGFEGLVQLLDSIHATEIDAFYRQLLHRLACINGSELFDDDLTFILLQQNDPPASWPRRLLGAGQNLMMRWIKRRERHCHTEPDNMRGATL